MEVGTMKATSVTKAKEGFELHLGYFFMRT
jgi:hypothetical protein